MSGDVQATARASLARLLRSTESPRALTPVSYYLVDGTRKQRLVAVVVSAQGFGDEARWALESGSRGFQRPRNLGMLKLGQLRPLSSNSIFVWKRIDATRAVLYLVIPILRDFRISIGKGGFSLVLGECSSTSIDLATQPPEFVLSFKTYNLDPYKAPAFGRSSASQQVILSMARVSVILEAVEGGSASLQELIAEATRYRKAAEQRNYRRDGISHKWIQYYALRTNLLLGPSSVEWRRPSSAGLGTNATSNEVPPSATAPSDDMDAAILQQELEAPITTTTNTTKAAALDPNAYNPFVYFTSAVPARAVSVVKETWVAKELKKTEEEFTSWTDLRVLAGTWNVGGKLSTESLVPWLKFADHKTAKNNQPDLLVLGFQEIDPSTQAYLYNDRTIPDFWISSVTRALDSLGYPPSTYKVVAQAKNVGMFMVVFARANLVSSITEVATTYVGTGLLWRMGNKGCVAVRMRVHDSYVVIVNSHLAADQDAVARRNADFGEIVKRVELPWTSTGESLGAPGYVTGASLAEQIEGYRDLTVAAREWRAMGIPNGPGKAGSGAMVFDAEWVTRCRSHLLKKWLFADFLFLAHSHLIWLGDLNYRIDLSSQEIRSAISSGKLSSLATADQLRNQRSRRAAFVDFSEYPISFPPTYKFDVGTNTYDTSDKQRAPAWTDRILWYDPKDVSRPQVECLGYKSAMELASSDHKPVAALLGIKVRKILRDVFDEHHQLINRLLDKYEVGFFCVGAGPLDHKVNQLLRNLQNDAYPDVKVSTNIVELGEIRFLESKELDISIENVGKIAANFDFLFPWDLQAAQEGSNGTISPQTSSSWLAPVPASGTLLPRASTISKIVAAPGSDALKTLNRGEPMDEVLVLRVLNGSEKFVNVSGRFMESCFGLPLPLYGALALSGKGIRDLGWKGLEALAKEPNPAGTNPPAPLVQMIEWLLRHGMDVSGLFGTPLNTKKEVELYIRECLDLGVDWSEAVLMGRDLSGSSQSLSLQTVSDDILAPAWNATLLKPDDKSLAVHSMCSTVLRFLAELDDGLIPARLLPRLLAEGASTAEAGMIVLRQIPEQNFNTFFYVVNYLKEVLANYLFADQLSVDKLGGLDGEDEANEN